MLKIKQKKSLAKHTIATHLTSTSIAALENSNILIEYGVP